jgi:hypothetical protein
MGVTSRRHTWAISTRFIRNPKGKKLMWKRLPSWKDNKLPAFYWTRRVINVLHRSLSWARSIQSIPPHPNSLRSILILSYYLRLGFTGSLFLSGFPGKILYAFLYSPFVLHALPCQLRWLDHCNYTWRRIQVVKLLVMQFAPNYYHFIHLRSKYSPQHPVLKYPQSTFLCERLSFTPIQSYRQNYSFVYFNFTMVTMKNLIFWDTTQCSLTEVYRRFGKSVLSSYEDSKSKRRFCLLYSLFDTEGASLLSSEMWVSYYPTSCRHFPEDYTLQCLNLY